MTDKPKLTPIAPEPVSAAGDETGAGKRTLRRSEVEDATARAVAMWMRGQALALAAQPLPTDAVALAIHSASVQSTLLLANGVEGGNWRPEASAPVARST